jgi:hypothetical protein
MSDDVRAPLGWRLDGSPIWGYSGAADGDGDDGTGDGDGEGDDGDGDGDENLDDVTRLTRSIEAERKATKTAKDGLRPFVRLCRELGVKDADALRELVAKANGQTSDTDDKVAKAREEILSRANTRIVKSEIKTLAAKDFADPSDAIRFLEIGDYEVDEDGNVDERAITKDLKSLLRDKPHLAKKGREPGFEPGARRTPEGATDMSDRIRRLAGRGRR